MKLHTMNTIMPPQVKHLHLYTCSFQGTSFQLHVQNIQYHSHSNYMVHIKDVVCICVHSTTVILEFVHMNDNDEWLGVSLLCSKIYLIMLCCTAPKNYLLCSTNVPIMLKFCSLKWLMHYNLNFAMAN